MALNPFMLSKRLNEASMGYVPSNIPAWNFAGDTLTGATAEMNNEVMSEAACINEFIVTSDDLLAETALNNPGNFETLHEGVFSTIKEKVVGFFKKLIAMVKGIIEKLKASFFKMTNQTGKWLQVMRPKIKAAQGQPGMADVTYEMHEYKPEYILKTIPDKISKFCDDWKKESGIQSIDKDEIADLLKNARNEIGSKASATQGMKYDDNLHHYGPSDEDPEAVDTSKKVSNRDMLQPKVDELNKMRDELKDGLTEFQKGWASNVASLMGVAGTTMDAVEANIVKAARGAEKKEIKIGSSVDSMVKTVEDSKDAISNLKDTYEKHMKFLESAKTGLEKTGNGFDPKTEKDNVIPGEVMTAAREAYTALYNNLTQITQAYETEMGKIRNINTSLVTQMAQEYMGALTKFANYKGKKE